MEARTGGEAGERVPDPQPSSDEAWDALFARYAPLALRLARGIVPHGDQAEDVVQQAAHAVLERSASGAAPFASPEHARNYFLRAVHNRALDVVRVSDRERVQLPEADEARESGEHRRPLAPVSAVSPIPLEEHEPFRAERLRRALDQLHPAEREAVRLRYLEGLAYREIAERTGVSISTLHSRVDAGLKKLGERIGKG